MHHRPTERLTVSRWFIHMFGPGDVVALADAGETPAAYPLTTIQSF